jgi:hypothetical protein
MSKANIFVEKLADDTYVYQYPDDEDRWHTDSKAALRDEVVLDAIKYAEEFEEAVFEPGQKYEYTISVTVKKVK